MRILEVGSVLLVAAAAGPGAAQAAWGTALDMSAPGNAASGRANAAVAVAHGGAFVAAWAWGRPGSRATTAVQARQVSAQGAAGRLLVLASGRRPVADVRLWPAPGGAAVATWSQGRAIVLRRIDADGGLGPAVRVTASGAGAKGVVAVPRADGSVTAAWIDEASVVRARRVSRSGRGGPVSALTRRGDRADELVGAPDMDQGVLLVSNVGGTLFGQRITATGAAPRPTFQISPSGRPAAAAQVSADGTGGATVVWQQQGAIEEAAVIADDKIGGIDRLSAPGTTALTPALAVRGLDAEVVWEARSGRRAVVVGLDANGGRRTLSRPSGSGMRPHAAIGGAGHAFVVWQRRVGATWQVQGSAAGSRAVSLSRPSARETFPHVAAVRRAAIAVWVRDGRVQAAVGRAGGRAR